MAHARQPATRRDLQCGSAILALRRAVLLETSENINPFPA